jgi:hypothetical protein
MSDKNGRILGMDEAEFLKEMVARYERGYEADKEDREAAKLDLEFSQGIGHWDDETKKTRDEEGRPSLVINKLPELIDQVVGAQRKMNVTIKVRALDEDSNIETVETLNGLLVRIAHSSKAANAYDNGFSSSAHCGRGFWRILTDYVDDEGFEQEILIKPIKERFSVVIDPAAKEDDRSDMNWAFITDNLQKEDFKDQYGEDFNPTDWAAASDSGAWVSDDEVRIVEYFFKHKVGTKTLYLIERNVDGFASSGETEIVENIDENDKSISILNKRVVDIHEVKWVKATADRILEGPIDIPSKYIPIVPVLGKEITIDGKQRTRGVIRFAHDAQRMYNYWRSTSAETMTLQPIAPYIITPTQLSGYESFWANAHKKTFPYLPYNPDPQAHGKPQRELPPQGSSGLTQEAMISDQEIRSTVGIHQPSTGEGGAATSGRAIGLLQEKGDTGTFEYIDNLHKAMEHTGRIIVDMIPKIYDTERKIRIQASDGRSSNQVVINSTDPDTGEPINDLRTGRYEVIIDTGPDYATMRLESMDFWMNFIRQAPNVAGQVADIIARNADIKDADEVEARLRKPLLAAGVVEPREGEAVPEKPEDPMQKFRMQKELAEVKQAEEKAREAESRARKAELETREKAIELLIRADEDPRFGPGRGQVNLGV